MGRLMKLPQTAIVIWLGKNGESAPEHRSVLWLRDEHRTFMKPRSDYISVYRSAVWLGNEHGAKYSKTCTALCRTTPSSPVPKLRSAFCCEQAPEHMCMFWHSEELEYEQKDELKLARCWRDMSDGLSEADHRSVPWRDDGKYEINMSSNSLSS